MNTHRKTSMLVVGLSPTRDAQQFFGGYHGILEPLGDDKIRVSDTCYLLDTLKGYPYIQQVIQYFQRFQEPFLIVVSELADSPVTIHRVPVTLIQWLDSRDIQYVKTELEKKTK